MIAILALSLLSTPAASVVAPCLSLSQDPNLKEEFKRFEAILKSKTEEGEAISMMDGFVGRFRVLQEQIDNINDSLAIGEGERKALLSERKKLGKQQEALAAEIYKAFVHKSRKAINEANLQMWRAGAYSLGQMGEPGADYLWKIFEHKKFKDEPDFRGLCLQQIGYTHAYVAYVKELIDLLDHHEYLFIAKASDALAQFGDAPGDIRKRAVERLVILLAQNWEATISDKTDEESQRKYRKTGQAMRNALEALTGTTQSDPQQWTHWWNKNKKNKEVWADD